MSDRLIQNTIASKTVPVKMYKMLIVPTVCPNLARLQLNLLVDIWTTGPARLTAVFKHLKMDFNKVTSLWNRGKFSFLSIQLKIIPIWEGPFRYCAGRFQFKELGQVEDYCVEHHRYNEVARRKLLSGWIGHISFWTLKQLVGIKVG